MVSTSAALASNIWACTWPVLGLRTSAMRVDVGTLRLPSMKCWRGMNIGGLPGVGVSESVVVMGCIGYR